MGALAKQMDSGAGVEDDGALAKIPKYEQGIARILKDLSSSRVSGNMVELFGRDPADPCCDSDSTLEMAAFKRFSQHSPSVAGDSLRP